MNDRPGKLDLNTLLYPSEAYGHPDDVLADPDLTTEEKRAVLASWASDARAIAQEPPLRLTPGGRVVAVQDVLDALKRLDREPDTPPVSKGVLFNFAKRGRFNEGDRG
jgi:hypothetical protein